MSRKEQRNTISGAKTDVNNLYTLHYFVYFPTKLVNMFDHPERYKGNYGNLHFNRFSILCIFCQVPVFIIRPFKSKGFVIFCTSIFSINTQAHLTPPPQCVPWQLLLPPWHLGRGHRLGLPGGKMENRGVEAWIWIISKLCPFRESVSFLFVMT